MKNLLVFFFALMFFVTVMLSCKRERLTDTCQASTELNAPPNNSASAHESDEWSVPVHLGPEINSSSRELGASLSADGLSLYFNSDRPLGLQTFDIYVSHRACIDCPWETAQMVGPPISLTSNDGTPALSHDGHLLFFCSDRGGQGALDLWVSHRSNPNDDFGWEAPINLGPFVNSTEDEASPSYVVAAAGAHAELYFSRGGRTWVAPISRDGEVLAPAVQLDLGGDAQSPSVRKDGKELVFWRVVLGNSDIWTSTRHNINDPWSTPVNIGAPVNTSFGGEIEAALSADGNTLVFSGNRLRGSSLGLNDIWISTRVHD